MSNVSPQTPTSRWLVTLLGEPYDLEDLPLWFPDGSVHVIVEEGTYYVCGALFESLVDSNEVREVAEAVLDTFTAIAKLLYGNYRRSRSLSDLSLPDRT